MYRIVHGSTHGLPDVAAFLETLETLGEHRTAEAHHLFDPHTDLFVARAPGRLDVMGGIADYSGSLVLQLPIREAALVALQPSESRSLRIVSLGTEANGRTPYFEMSLGDLERDGAAISYQEACSFFRRDAASSWAGICCGRFSGIDARARRPFQTRRATLD